MFRIVYLTEDPGCRAEVEGFLRQWESEEAHIVAHTSGSTGAPKEIRLPKSDIMVSARATNRRFGINSGSRLLCPLSANYIAGKMMIARAIAADCEVAFCRPSNRFLQSPEATGYLAGGVDLLPIVPSQCLSLLESLKSNPSAIRNVIIGGGALPHDAEEALLAARPPGMGIFATYGMTETCSHVALRGLGEEHFTAMPGVSFSLDNRECLRITAPEYSFTELQTNDIARLVNDSEFIWRGRFDNVINSGGIKIFPEETERKLLGKLPCRFYLKGVADPKWGEAVRLVIEDDPASPCVSDESIMEICRECLSPFELPKSIRRVKTLPVTSTGKLRRV